MTVFSYSILRPASGFLPPGRKKAMPHTIHTIYGINCRLAQGADKAAEAMIKKSRDEEAND
jgi:hypothetical protein